MKKDINKWKVWVRVSQATQSNTVLVSWYWMRSWWGWCWNQVSCNQINQCISDNPITQFTITNLINSQLALPSWGLLTNLCSAIVACYEAHIAIGWTDPEFLAEMISWFNEPIIIDKVLAIVNNALATQPNPKLSNLCSYINKCIDDNLLVVSNAAWNIITTWPDGWAYLNITIPQDISNLTCNWTPVSATNKILTTATLDANTTLPTTIVATPNPAIATNKFVKAVKVNTICNEDIFVPIVDWAAAIDTSLHSCPNPTIPFQLIQPSILWDATISSRIDITNATTITVNTDLSQRKVVTNGSQILVPGDLLIASGQHIQVNNNLWITVIWWWALFDLWPSWLTSTITINKPSIVQMSRALNFTQNQPSWALSWAFQLMLDWAAYTWINWNPTYRPTYSIWWWNYRWSHTLYWQYDLNPWTYILSLWASFNNTYDFTRNEADGNITILTK